MDNQPKYKLQGKFSDLEIEWFNAHRGMPTTEFQSSRPFMFVFESIGDSKDDVVVYSRYRSSTEGKPDWFVAFNGGTTEDSDLFFKVIYLQEENQAPIPYWTEKGRKLADTYLSSFINECDEFGGSVMAISSAFGRENVDISFDGVDLLFSSTDKIYSSLKKSEIGMVVIEHQEIPSDTLNVVALNVETMEVTSNTIKL